MNASFRTAFWALCLGITVPMVLFIGVELISPGSTSRKATVAAADRNESLQSRLQTAAQKPAKGRLQSAGSDSRAGATPASGAAQPKATTSLAQEASPRGPTGPGQSDSESGEPQVVLGPDLEPDQTASDAESGSDRRVPAVPAHTRPKVRILPDIEPLPASGGRTNAALEERLAGIQSNLDKIGRTLDSQALREPPVDPVKQVAELLKQLQEARRRDATSQPEEPVTHAPADENHDSADVQNRSAALPPDAAQGSAPRETETRDTERSSQPVTRIYRPRYLSGSALQALVEPLLTRNLGRTGAADADSADPETPSSGSSSGSPANALVVHDLPQVMRRIDKLIAKLDVPPTQVTLEAVVITLQLNAGQPQGIDLRGFNATNQLFAVSPVDSGPGFAATSGLTLTNGFGLKCGVLTGDPQAFLNALEAPAQTRSARAWQMTVVNRQSALLMLNDPFSPEGSGDEFSAGTILKIRPVVDRTGLVQLDVRREVSLGGPTSGSRSAALTNQIALHAGQTAVVGGFFAEQTALQFYRRPGFGQLPLVGGLFLKQAEVVERCETIVLLTPHVIAPAADADSQFVNKPQASTKKAATDSAVHASHTVPANTPGSQTWPSNRPRPKP